MIRPLSHPMEGAFDYNQRTTAVSDGQNRTLNLGIRQMDRTITIGRRLSRQTVNQDE